MYAFSSVSLLWLPIVAYYAYFKINKPIKIIEAVGLQKLENSYMNQDVSAMITNEVDLKLLKYTSCNLQVTFEQHGKRYICTKPTVKFTFPILNQISDKPVMSWIQKATVNRKFKDDDELLSETCTELIQSHAGPLSNFFDVYYDFHWAFADEDLSKYDIFEVEITDVYMRKYVIDVKTNKSPNEIEIELDHNVRLYTRFMYDFEKI